MEQLQTYFSQHAKEILEAKRFSQASLADAMGVKRQNLAKVVFQSNNIQVLLKAAQILDVSLDYLLYGKRTDEQEVNGFVEIDGKVHRITNKQQLIELVNSISE